MKWIATRHVQLLAASRFDGVLLALHKHEFTTPGNGPDGSVCQTGRLTTTKWSYVRHEGSCVEVRDAIKNIHAQLVGVSCDTPRLRGHSIRTPSPAKRCSTTDGLAATTPSLALLYSSHSTTKTPELGHQASARALAYKRSPRTRPPEPLMP